MVDVVRLDVADLAADISFRSVYFDLSPMMIYFGFCSDCFHYSARYFPVGYRDRSFWMLLTFWSSSIEVNTVWVFTFPSRLLMTNCRRWSACLFVPGHSVGTGRDSSLHIAIQLFSRIIQISSIRHSQSQALCYGLVARLGLSAGNSGFILCSCLCKSLRRWEMSLGRVWQDCLPQSLIPTLAQEWRSAQIHNTATDWPTSCQESPSRVRTKFSHYTNLHILYYCIVLYY